MSKSNLLQSLLTSKEGRAVVCLVLICSGLLFSRGLLSVSMGLFTINGLWGIHPKEYIKVRFWIVGLLWVLIYALSYFWSEDKSQWNNFTTIKLPILLLPLAFAFVPRMSAAQLKLLTYCILLLLAGGALYSISFLFKDYDHYIKGYTVSHLLPTPAYNDHVRFSAAVAAAICFTVSTWAYIPSRAYTIVTGFVVLFLAAYLHILAAKTGLVMLYLFVLCYPVYMLLRKQWIPAILFLLFFMGGIMLAVKKMPTLKERINYTFYTYDRYKEGSKSGSYSDLGRIISYRLAIGVIEKNALIGVGAGDMMPEMKAAYDRHYPDIKDNERLLPHNQPLIVALATGIPNLVLFIVWLLWPLRVAGKPRSFFYLTASMMAIAAIMVDVSLETQMGIAVYLLFTLLQRHLLLGGEGLRKEHL